jgi:hypothetical protein
MKKFLSIFLLALFIAPVAMKVLVLGNYFLELDAYMERCENRAQPELKCNGTCQFAKELQALEQEQEPRIPESVKLEWAPFFIQKAGFKNVVVVFIPKNNYPVFPHPYTAPALEIVVPPPVFVV